MSVYSKKSAVEEMLSNGQIAIHVDTRMPGVVMPPKLMGQQHVMLEIGLDMALPVPDLVVDDEGVFATLSFGRNGFKCFVPWDAIFSVVHPDAIQIMWALVKGEESTKRKRPALSLVSG